MDAAFHLAQAIIYCTWTWPSDVQHNMKLIWTVLHWSQLRRITALSCVECSTKCRITVLVLHLGQSMGAALVFFNFNSAVCVQLIYNGSKTRVVQGQIYCSRPARYADQNNAARTIKCIVCSTAGRPSPPELDTTHFRWMQTAPRYPYFCSSDAVALRPTTKYLGINYVV